MGNKDIVSKNLIRKLAVDMATYLLDLDIDADSLELIATEQQRVEDRRADLVAKVRLNNVDEDFILHIEIQNQHDALMPWRMLRYLTDIRLINPQLRVHQHVIYIGKQPLRLKNRITETDLDFHYHLTDMRQIDCQQLMALNNPDALVLAILCDFGEQSAQTQVQAILAKLKSLIGDNEKRLREYIDMISILSENRDLQPQVSEAAKMLTQVDPTKMPFFAMGHEEGLKEGLKEGALKTKLEDAKNLLDLLPDQVIAERLGLPLEKVQALRD